MALGILGDVSNALKAISPEAVEELKGKLDTFILGTAQGLNAFNHNLVELVKAQRATTEMQERMVKLLEVLVARQPPSMAEIMEKVSIEDMNDLQQAYRDGGTPSVYDQPLQLTVNGAHAAPEEITQ